ncbi:hypothetical protein NP493_2305g00000 [Ridgeia piscesae]|uniref:Uncharacterized protein n=1 Tax=Ridgeia piscesae TaxID=27915 RepID=A0AAD9N1P2_RIDPI|nr:hypothetical protein NP493_2305g00000 [Ridgeia piscesae]
MGWRNFAAALNALIGECSKRPQPTFTNTQGQSAITSPSAKAYDKRWFNTYIKHKLQSKLDA